MVSYAAFSTLLHSAYIRFSVMTSLREAWREFDSILKVKKEIKRSPKYVSLKSHFSELNVEANPSISGNIDVSYSNFRYCIVLLFRFKMLAMNVALITI